MMEIYVYGNQKIVTFNNCTYYHQRIKSNIENLDRKLKKLLRTKWKKTFSIIEWKNTIHEINQWMN